MEEGHSSNLIRTSDISIKSNDAEASKKAFAKHRATVPSKSSNEDKQLAFDAKVNKWKQRGAYMAVQANIGSHVVYRRKMGGSAKARIFLWGNRDKNKDFLARGCRLD